MSLDDRNAELEEKLEHNPIDEQIAALARSDKSRKRQVRWLAISLALDVLLTIGFGYTTLQANEAAKKAETNEVAIVRNCETANQSRKDQRELWGYVISLTPIEPRTEAQTNRVNQFSDFVDKTFAQRDCQGELKK